MISDGAAAARAREDARGIPASGTRRTSSTNGKVPCCVDARGADPVPENDSHGEFIYLVAEYYRYTGDRALLETMWPHVDERGRIHGRAAPRANAPKRTAAANARVLRPDAGVDQPRRLLGEADAFVLGRFLGAARLQGRGRASRTRSGEDRRCTRFAGSRDQFRGDLYASIRRRDETHGIDYMPGLGGARRLRRDVDDDRALARRRAGRCSRRTLLVATFERYWKRVRARRDGDETGMPTRRTSGAPSARSSAWAGATARTSCSTSSCNDQRPREWNQWAEVVGREPRKSRFIGDMPHTLGRLGLHPLAARHVRVRAAGRRDARADGAACRGVDASGRVRRDGTCATQYGPLRYSLRVEDDQVVLDVAEIEMPNGGLAVAWPEGDHRSVRRFNSGRRAGSARSCASRSCRSPSCSAPVRQSMMRSVERRTVRCG